jgi:hypothetical protein
MNPAVTWMPWARILCSLARGSPGMFWNFCVVLRSWGSGVSMPTKTRRRPARAIASSRPGSSARLTEASVKYAKGWPLRSFQRASSSSIAFAFFLFPMKLSSTRKT